MRRPGRSTSGSSGGRESESLSFDGLTGKRFPWRKRFCRRIPSAREKDDRAVKLLSDDDLHLREMTGDELERAFDLWFDLAQHTNDYDPPYTHGVFVRLGEQETSPHSGERPRP